MGFRDTLVFGIGKIVPDYVLVQLRYFQHFRKFANLKNPQTFNEKLNWLKLYYHKPLFTRMVDKYEAKKYVEEKVGKQYVVPNIRGGYGTMLTR